MFEVISDEKGEFSATRRSSSNTSAEDKHKANQFMINTYDEDHSIL